MVNVGLEELIDRSAAPLDRVRGRALGAVLRAPWLGWALERRDRRLTLLAVLHMAVAFPLAVLAPSLLLVIGPLLLGVPHVASDVRYLVLRRRLPSWWKRAIWVGCVGLFAVRLVEELAPAGRWMATGEMVAALAWVVVGALAGARGQAGSRRVGIVMAVVAVAATVFVVAPSVSRLAITHAHNVVAIGIWAWLFGSRWRAALIPLTLAAGGAALLASGSMAVVTLHGGAPDLLGLHVLLAADWLAPGLPVATAVGLTCAFAFLQSVHYVVWLALIPQSDMHAQGSATFRMSARSLVRDFGPLALGAIVVVTLVVAVGGLFEPIAARATFLSLASFHAYFELAMVAYFFTRAERAGRGDSR